MDIEAVAFDIDGTLYPNHLMYLNSFGFSLFRFRLLYHFRGVRREIRRTRPIEDFRRTQAELLANSMGIPVNRAMHKIERSIYGAWERSLKRIKPFRYVDTLIRHLKESGLKLGVLSDFPIGEKLAYLGLQGLWDCVISAEDTGYLKPSPEPFLCLTECLGVPPENVLYVGNDYEYDIVGATRVGMKTAHLSREPVSNSPALLTFSDYQSLESELFKAVRS